MSIGNDFKSSITGNVETAYIVIKDWRKEGNSKVRNEKEEQAFLAMYATQEVYIKDKYEKKTFKVQFNPSEIKLYANSRQAKKNDVTNNNKKPETINSDEPYVECSFTLIFDKVNVYDAFMFDKMPSVGVSGAAKIKAAMDTAKSKDWTVQTEVEGLLAVLNSPYTQFITFYWASFSFYGQIISMKPTYTMFSVSGKPIRAKVEIRIKQKVIEQDNYGDFREDGNKWTQAFEAFLKGDKNSLKSKHQKVLLQHKGQKINNLINLNF